jgi:hypothetical protein
VAERYLEGIRDDQRVHLDDDRLCAHLAYDHLQACLDFFEGERTGEIAPHPGRRRYWPSARLYIHRDAERRAWLSAAKGGVVRLHVGRSLAYCDSGLVARFADGQVVVSHLIGPYEVEILETGIRVAGNFGRVRFRLPSPLGQAIFHVGMLLLGRWGSDWVRALLQRILIVGKRDDPMRFQRTLTMGKEVRLVDEIWNPLVKGARRRVVELYAGTDHTSIYVAMSRSYQRACLLRWTHYGECLEPLHREGYSRVDRVIG